MSLRSTSLINISGDKKLNIFLSFFWLLINIFNNLFANFQIDKKIKFIKFNSKISDLSYIEQNKYLSPARYLCDLFWISFPFNKFYNQFTKPINICEVGCGTGVYPALLKKIIVNKKISYTGIDLKEYKEWESFDTKNFRFIIDKSDNIKNYLNNIDFLFTQSAIEHFDQDLFFFKQIAEYVSKVKKPFLQIHLFPSHKCLFTYLNHGYRQYTPRKISKITKNFKKNSDVFLYELASYNANNIHREFITFPKIFKLKDKRFSNNKEYINQIINSFNNESNNRQLTFYALVISTNNKIDLN